MNIHSGSPSGVTSGLGPGASCPAPRVALVTGAGQRIGRAIALGLAARGWRLGVHYHASAREAEQVVREIEAAGGRALALHADLADSSATAALLPVLAAALGRPACVVNNASAFIEDTAEHFDPALLARLTLVNVGAPLILARSLHQLIPETADKREDERGVVINLLDQKLFNLNPDYLSYTLTKAALQTATVTLAQALAPKLRVVGVAPGLTLPADGQSEHGFAAACRLTPLKRASRPEDVVDAVCFLAQARGITGATLVVDGGQHLVPLPRDVMFLAS